MRRTPASCWRASRRRCPRAIWPGGCWPASWPGYPVGETIRPVAIDTRPDRRQAPGPRLSRADFAHEGSLFRINIGARDKADPRWLLPLICRRGNVTRREVGAIRIGPSETTFEIAGEAADAYAQASSETDPRAPHVRISRGSAAAGFGAKAGPAGGFKPRSAGPARAANAPRGAGGPKGGNAPRAGEVLSRR